MTTFGFVNGVKRPRAPSSKYKIEYTSSEHRGIIMYSEAHAATSVAGAMAYAKAQLPNMAGKYGARGYRVRDVEQRLHRSDASRDDE